MIGCKHMLVSPTRVACVPRRVAVHAGNDKAAGVCTDPGRARLRWIPLTCAQHFCNAVPERHLEKTSLLKLVLSC